MSDKQENASFPGLDSDFLAAARKLIAANSITELGNMPAVETLEPLWREAGFETALQPSPEAPERDANLIAGPGGGPHAQGEPLLLVTHLDTVPPGPRDRWLSDPFSFTIRGDKAFGLGVADVKLDALCKLWAAKRLKDVALRRPFYFLGTYGEEAGLRGAKHFVANLPFKPAFVLAGEPSELGLFTAHKGYAVVRVRIEVRDREAASDPLTSDTPTARWRVLFSGKAAHSSTPALGQNAIESALSTLETLGLNGDTPRWQLESITGGEAPNMIPASCEIVLRGAEAPSIPGARVERIEESEQIEQIAGVEGSEGLEQIEGIDQREKVQDSDRAADSKASPASRKTLAPLLPTLRAIHQLWTRSAHDLEPKADQRFDPAQTVANLTQVSSELVRTLSNPLKEEQKDGRSDSAPTAPPSSLSATLSPTHLKDPKSKQPSAHSSHRVAPLSAIELTFDARLLPAHNAEDFITDFAKGLEALEQELRRGERVGESGKESREQSQEGSLERPSGASTRAGGELRIQLLSSRAANGMGQSADSSFVKMAGEALTQVGLDPSPKARPTSTEGGVFFHAGFPAAIFGPSLSTGNAHTPNEHARLHEVAKAIDAYEALIRRLCGVDDCQG